jgi:hypothetical protein
MGTWTIGRKMTGKAMREVIDYRMWEASAQHMRRMRITKGAQASKIFEHGQCRIISNTKCLEIEGSFSLPITHEMLITTKTRGRRYAQVAKLTSLLLSILIVQHLSFEENYCQASN